MITINLCGGLGNQLFQLSNLEYFSKKYNKKIFIYNFETPKGISNPHSDKNYYDNIFKNWRSYFNNCLKYPNYILLDDVKVNQINIICRIGHVVIQGFLQDYRYTDFVRESFIPQLSFNNDILNKYPTISQKIFVHIRGGDYFIHTNFFVNLEKYYKTCLDKHNKDELVVFTNDKEYAKKIMKDQQYEIVEENEIDTLYLMSKCKGCICANSTFSWWGAYLNPNRPIYLPSKWNHKATNFTNYFFKNSIIVDTE